MFRTIGVVVLAALAGGAAMSERQVAQSDLSRVEWRYYSGDNGSTKYSPIDQITKSNVGSLKIAWRRPQIDPSLLKGATVRIFNNFRSTPIMAGGVMYASNAVGLAEAFDPETGKTLWVQSAAADDLRGTANRGVAYWGDGADARIITFRGPYLFALNQRPVSRFRRSARTSSISRRCRSAQHRLSLELRSADRARRDRHGIGDGRSGFGDEDRRRSRRRARV
jgi:glucose dehydrogenase